MASRPRRATTASAAFVATLALAACGGLMDSSRSVRSREPAVAEPVVSAGDRIGTGSVKVALILPSSGPGQAGAAASSLRNAAELAASEFGGADLAITVKDDRGTAEGARAAAESALAEGAELILGPLFSPAVAAAGSVARTAGKPVVAFSTDSAVASRGVYLLSFLPAGEVDRIVDYAAAQGRTAFAALIPNTTYGSVAEAAFREAAARRGIRVVTIEHYAPGQPGPAVQRLASVVSGAGPQADAMFIPAGAEELPAIGASLQAAGVSPSRVKLVGTGTWNDPRAFTVPALQGAWFAAPDPAGFTAFAARYRARFGSDPTRIATLAYDATSLAAALAKTRGSERFTDAALQTPTGFAGADGAFRFRPDGTSERALAVHEIRPEGAAVISPAPKSFGPSGT